MTKITAAERIGGLIGMLENVHTELGDYGPEHHCDKARIAVAEALSYLRAAPTDDPYWSDYGQ